MKRMKKLVFLAVAVVFAFQLVGCGSGTQSQKNTNQTGSAKAEEKKSDSNTGEKLTIRVGVQPPISLPYLADRLGYFEDEFKKDGINVELVEFPLGPPLVEAFGSGQLDIGFLGDLPAFAGLINGGEYKIIGKYERDYQRGLIVRDDAKIKKLSDLKGKKIGVSFGSNLQPLVEIYLKSAGLTDADVELVNLSLADITTSIGNGNIDAAVTDEPYITQAVNNGGVTRLTDSKGYKTYSSPIIAHNSFTAEHADLTARVLKALAKASDWLKDNKEEAKKIHSEATGLDLLSVAPKIDNAVLTVDLSKEDIEALVVGAKQEYELGLLKKDLKVEDYIDTSFLEKAGIQ